MGQRVLSGFFYLNGKMVFSEANLQITSTDTDLIDFQCQQIRSESSRFQSTLNTLNSQIFSLVGITRIVMFPFGKTRRNLGLMFPMLFPTY